MCEISEHGRGEWFLQSTRQVKMGNDKEAEPWPQSSSIPLETREVWRRKVMYKRHRDGFWRASRQSYRQGWDTLLCWILAPCSDCRQAQDTGQAQPGVHQLPGALLHLSVHCWCQDKPLGMTFILVDSLYPECWCFLWLWAILEPGAQEMKL